MERRTKMAMDGRRRFPQGGYHTRSRTNWLTMKDRKNKRVQEEEDYDLGLSFTIHGGYEIDPLSDTVADRTYFLVWWLEGKRENWAPFPERGNPINPAWERVWKQRHDIDVWPGFIYVEVMRRRDQFGAGTSGGIFTMVEKGREIVANPGTRGATEYGIESVSRVKIPLPKPGMKIFGRFGLVKSDGPGLTGQGHISVTMEVEKLPTLT